MQVAEEICRMNESLELEFISKGCKSRRDAAVAAQVYLELCEVKRYWDVEHSYSESLEKLYFTARKVKSEKPSIFVPIPVSETVSFIELQKLFKLNNTVDYQGVYMAIVHSDSTCVYYQIFDGLGEPPADTSKSVKNDQSQKLDADLKKHKPILEQAALCGIPVTIPKKQKGEGASASGT